MITHFGSAIEIIIDQAIIRFKVDRSFDLVVYFLQFRYECLEWVVHLRIIICFPETGRFTGNLLSSHFTVAINCSNSSADALIKLSIYVIPEIIQYRYCYYLPLHSLTILFPGFGKSSSFQHFIRLYLIHLPSYYKSTLFLAQDLQLYFWNPMMN